MAIEHLGDEQDRKRLYKAQLAYTQQMIEQALKDDLELSDDRCDYLKGALHCSLSLVVEFAEGMPFVDKASLLEFPGDSLCAELRKLIEE